MGDPAEKPPAPLRQAAITGARWSAIAGVITFALSFGQNAVLGRLLSPIDFGLAGMIWTVLGLAQLFAEAGMGNVLFYRQESTRRETSSIFWLNFMATSLLALLIAAGAPALAWFNREPALLPLVPWAVASFWIAGASSPFRVLLQKEMRFQALASIEIAAAAAALSVAITVALAGGGVYALLAAGIASAGIRLLCSVFSLLARRTPEGAGFPKFDFPVSFHFRRTDIAAVFNYGLYQLGEKAANYLWSNLDYLLVGRLLGTGALGYYRMAYETAIRPLSVINPIFNSVAYPLFARKQDDAEAMRRGYVEMVSYIGILVCPLMAGLLVTAPLAIEVLVGPQWLPAVPALRILCVVGLLRSLQNPVGALLVAKGRARTGFLANIAMLAMNLALFPFATARGLEWLAAAAGVTMLLNTVVFWRSFYWDTIQLPPGELLKPLVFPALLSTVMAVAVWFLTQWFPAGWPVVVKLLAAVAGGAAVYAGCYWIVDGATVRKFVRTITSRG